MHVEMRFAMKTIFLAHSLLIALSVCEATEILDSKDEAGPSDTQHQVQQRSLGFFTKPQQDHAKPPGPSIFGHIGNVLHGGSMGFGMEIRPMAPIRGIIDHAKKFIPGHQASKVPADKEVYPPHHERPYHPNRERPSLPNREWPSRPQQEHPHRPDYERPNRPDYERPDYERPNRPDYERPNRPDYERPNRPDNQRPNRPNYERPNRPDYERPNRPDYERPNRPERPGRPDYQRPNKPDQEEPSKPDKQEPKRPNKDEDYKDDLPSWEDIGENPDRDTPIEDLIQPRGRPKRFIESKIYHVPVQFRSNAKPYKVQFKRDNRKREQ